MTILSTKLYIPTPRANVINRQRLFDRLNEGKSRKVILVCAPAGSGKTTLVSCWLRNRTEHAAWVSLDESDDDPARFLLYLIAAIRTIAPSVGDRLLKLLQTPQPPPPELIISNLLNEITGISSPFFLVLDDYQFIASNSLINDAMKLLIEHMPEQLQLVLITREEPRLPTAKLRARNQLTDIRAADLSFTVVETSHYLKRSMELTLSEEHISYLQQLTEGWISGLQLAALTLRGQKEPGLAVQAFTGSHPFVLDYLAEEVLQRLPDLIQQFLLYTSILDRFCSSLCDALLRSEDSRSAGGAAYANANSQETLTYLERSNLFLVSLDNERCWYRYHHLFSDLLRKRLRQSSAFLHADGERLVVDLHLRASEWFEQHGLEMEAFQHAIAAKDTNRAARLVEGNGMPLLFRGAAAPVLEWLKALPKKELDARPSLRLLYASGQLMRGEISNLEAGLQAAETVLEGCEMDERTRDLLGHAAAIRAALAVSRHQAEVIIAESQRALELLRPNNLAVRVSTIWAQGYAYQLQGERDRAGRAYSEALALSQQLGHTVIEMMAMLGIGYIQEAGNQLYQAAETYRRLSLLAGDSPLPASCEAYLGLARVTYEWNDLPSAEQHGQRAVLLAKQLGQMDQAAAALLFLARLKLATKETDDAAVILAEADDLARQLNHVIQLRHIAEVRVSILLQQRNVAAAAHLAREHHLLCSQARVWLAHGDPDAALALLEPLLEQAEAKRLEDERLKVMVIQAAALEMHGQFEAALEQLSYALALGESGGMLRVFLDEGMPIWYLLQRATTKGIMPEYTGRLLTAFKGENGVGERSKHERDEVPWHVSAHLIEPLSDRELEVLRLIAAGLSNREIGERLFLALSTVKGYNQIIFNKLQVSRRTEAVARARSLGLI